MNSLFLGRMYNYMNFIFILINEFVRKLIKKISRPYTFSHAYLLLLLRLRSFPCADILIIAAQINKMTTLITCKKLFTIL